MCHIFQPTSSSILQLHINSYEESPSCAFISDKEYFQERVTQRAACEDCHIARCISWGIISRVNYLCQLLFRTPVDLLVFSGSCGLGIIYDGCASCACLCGRAACCTSADRKLKMRNSASHLCHAACLAHEFALKSLLRTAFRLFCTPIELIAGECCLLSKIQATQEWNDHDTLLRQQFVRQIELANNPQSQHSDGFASDLYQLVTDL